jgi:hypothetical protein
MTYRVTVYGPSTSSHFGADVFVVASPADIADREGVLTILLPGQPERPRPHDPTRVIKATRSAQIIYPRGGWTKVNIVDIIEEDS